MQDDPQLLGNHFQQNSMDDDLRCKAVPLQAIWEHASGLVDLSAKLQDLGVGV